MFLCLCTHTVSVVKLHKHLYIFCIIYYITINIAIKSYVERIASNEKLNMLVLVNWSYDELRDVEQRRQLHFIYTHYFGRYSKR